MPARGCLQLVGGATVYVTHAKVELMIWPGESPWTTIRGQSKKGQKHAALVCSKQCILVQHILGTLESILLPRLLQAHYAGWQYLASSCRLIQVTLKHLCSASAMKYVELPQWIQTERSRVLLDFTSTAG